MAVYFIQGTLGAGKTLTAVKRIQEYLKRGRPVATNVDLHPEYLVGKWNRTASIIRIPDEPNRGDFEALGKGRPEGSTDEEENGLIVLDECMIWFNSREYRNPERQGVIKWLANARKLGWDVYILIQNVEDVDSQARRAFMEHYVTCKRLDRMQLPLIGSLFRLIVGRPMELPRVHIGRVVYTVEDQKVDTWYTRGTELFKAYDTDQTFLGRGTVDPASDEDGIVTSYCLLPPWWTHGRHKRQRTKEDMMKIYMRLLRKLRIWIAFGSGMLASSVLAGSMIIANLGDDDSRPAVHEPLQQIDIKEDVEPEIKRFYIESTMSFEALRPGGLRGSEYSNMYLVSDTGVPYSQRELMQTGYSHRQITDCYHEFTDADGRIIPAVCMSSDRL